MLKKARVSVLTSDWLVWGTDTGLFVDWGHKHRCNWIYRFVIGAAEQVLLMPFKDEFAGFSMSSRR